VVSREQAAVGGPGRRYRDRIQARGEEKGDRGVGLIVLRARENPWVGGWKVVICFYESIG